MTEQISTACLQSDNNLIGQLFKFCVPFSSLTAPEKQFSYEAILKSSKSVVS